MWTT
jgi:hypothetical protein